jgi:uncharacterized protein YcaQ
MRTLTLTEARRLAVAGALLSEPRPTDMVGVVRSLAGIQVDPVAAVARAEQMALFSRLGPYDVGELKRHLEVTGELFEWGAFVFATDQLPMYRAVMESYPRGDSGRARYEREWLAANERFRRYILDELEERGALRSRDLDDRAEVPWQTGGWNDGKNLGRMLELLWMRGDIAIAARDGNERVWDLAHRVLPPLPPAPPDELARWAVSSQLRRRGVARPSTLGFASDGGRAAGWQAALDELVQDGAAVPVSLDGLDGEFLVDAQLLDRPFTGRTVILSPFDRLVADRARLHQLFGFRYKLEMYVPIDRREFGYYVLPVLDRETFVARLDARFDRRNRLLNVSGAWLEPDAPAEAWDRTSLAIHELATWLGATEVALAAPVRLG